MSAPLLDKIMQQTLAKSFGLTLELGLIPKTEIQVGNGNTKLEAMDVVFLNSALPHEFRNQWRLLFNSRYSNRNFIMLIYKIYGLFLIFLAIIPTFTWDIPKLQILL